MTMFSLSHSQKTTADQHWEAEKLLREQRVAAAATADPAPLVTFAACPRLASAAKEEAALGQWPEMPKRASL